MRRSKARGGGGVSARRMRESSFLEQNSGRRGDNRGPWGREWLHFLAKLRTLEGFHPERGAWHGSGEAPGKTLLDLLARGGWLSDGTASAAWERCNSSTWVPPSPPSCSGEGGVNESRRYTQSPPPPPPGESWLDRQRSPGQVGEGGWQEADLLDKKRCPHSPSGCNGSGGKLCLHRAKVHNILGLSIQPRGKMTGSGGGQRPQPPGGWGRSSSSRQLLWHTSLA